MIELPATSISAWLTVPSSPAKRSFSVKPNACESQSSIDATSS
jgi:hypothetical protein